MLRSDVAPLLLRHGLVSISHKLYLAKSSMYALEGWDRLRAHVLPHLIACFRSTDLPLLVAAGFELLSLPSDCLDETNTQVIQQEIVACANEVDRATFSDQYLVTAPCIEVRR